MLPQINASQEAEIQKRTDYVGRPMDKTLPKMQNIPHQNEMTECCTNEVIKSIVDELKKAGT